MPAMSAVLNRPPWWKYVFSVFRGFDGPLAFAVFILMCIGLTAMYSSGHDMGSRFADHGRNMLLAGFMMFVAAQIPPQRLVSFAVPLYTIGVALLMAVDLAFTSTPLVALISRSTSAVTVSTALVRPSDTPTATSLPAVWPVAVVFVLLV